MKRINFQKFEMPLGISHDRVQVGDARESVANLIYLNVCGIKAHALALKIYQSEGETEYSDEEVYIIVEVTNHHGTPAFIDGLRAQLEGGAE